MWTQLLSWIQLFVTPWMVAVQAPLFLEFSRQEYGVGCHFLFWGIFLTQGSNPCLLHLLHWQADSSALRHLGSFLVLIPKGLLSLSLSSFSPGHVTVLYHSPWAMKWVLHVYLLSTCPASVVFAKRGPMGMKATCLLPVDPEGLGCCQTLHRGTV